MLKMIFSTMFSLMMGKDMKFKTSCLKIEKEKLFLLDPNLRYHQVVNPKVNSHTQESKSVTMSPKVLSL